MKDKDINSDIDKVIAELGIVCASKFIPWSKSKKASEDYRTLNWTITLSRNGKEFLICPYSTGIAFCPSYRLTWRSTVHKECEWECEHGLDFQDHMPIVPDTRDVIFCLLKDAQALDFKDFEEWCNDLGMDSNSRKAEAIYQACLLNGWTLIRGLGEDGLEKLKEVFQDY